MFMLSASQGRVLRWLGRFSSSLSEAWDVPREISLPGISEAMGVVRSALHAPINTLLEEDLIICRLAHVIGGGSRRRNVYHLTEFGRKALEELPDTFEESSQRRGSLKGEYPEATELKGRDELIQKILDSGSDSFTVVGIAGIGKTVLAREISQRLAKQKINSRWARATTFDDANSLAQRMMEGAEVPEEPTALASWLSDRCKGDLLVIDDLQDLHARHLEGVKKMIETLQSNEQRMMLISRAPSMIEIGEVFSIEEVNDEAAMEILGGEIDEETALKAIEHLGGHPLALHMWNPEQPLAGAHIRRYVEQTVLTCIPEESMPTLDEVAVLPAPVELKHLSTTEGVDILDDHALLRWSHDQRVELQHLVRNVRRETWNEEESLAIHSRAADNWSTVSGEQARLIELHMRNNALEANITEYLDIHVDSLLLFDSAAVATLVDDACQRWPDAMQLKSIAVHTALERGEPEHAAKELAMMIDAPLELLARVARQKGLLDEAEKHILEAIDRATGLDKVKLQISEATRLLEDSLPDDDDPVPSQDAEKLINSISLTDLDTEERKRALVAIASLNHWIALNRNDADSAAQVRKGLENIAGDDDPIVSDLACRANIHFEGETSFSSDNPLRNLSLRLMTLHNLEDEEKIAALDGLELQDISTSRLGRRLAAMVWCWRGMLLKDERLSCWREAIHLFTSAECPKASKALTLRMHSLLR
jgi:DNA-binding MarR family transcriptional regulator